MPLPASFGPLANAIPFPTWLNRVWCKADTLAYFGLENDSHFQAEPITVATSAFFRKSPSCEAVVAKWRTAFMDDFSLIDDSPSRKANDPSFIEHRHDQSLFSCLSHIHGFRTLSNGELELPRSDLGAGNWGLLASHPIHARRDKTLSIKNRVLRSILGRWNRRRSV
jgi:hypothetical protein